MINMKSTRITLDKTYEKAIRSGLLLLGLFIVALWLNPLKAQIHYGVRGGLALSEPGLSTPLGSTQDITKTFAGIDIALLSEFDISESLSLQAELGYIEKGLRLDLNTSIDVLGARIPIGIVNTTKVKLLELPILAKYRFSTGKIDAYALAGPTVSYILGGVNKTRSTGLADLDITSQNFDIGNRYKFGLGLLGGVGIEKHIGTGKVFIDARYNYQTIDLGLVSDLENTTFRNNGIGLQVGYKFTL